MEGKYINIKNTVEIDPKALTLLGASTKRDDDSKIGFFGSGLKYAIAVLLRNDVEFKVFSGTKEIVIKTKKEKFRGQEFNNIIIDGRRTSLTKEMGVDWKAWFAIREIYCNALDEENGSITFVDEIKPVEGQTNFFINNETVFKELMENWDNYFTHRRNDLVIKVDRDKLFRSRTKTLIYRKGVQCYESQGKALYDYDLSWVEINESRVLRSFFNVAWELGKYLAQHSTKEMVKNIFDNYNDTLEEELYWEYAKYYNDNWLDVIDGRTLIRKNTAGHFQKEMSQVKHLVLPDKMVKSLSAYYGDKVKVLGRSSWCGDFVVVDPTEKQQNLINGALTFLIDSEVKIKYKVKMAVFKEINVLGHANGEEILLSALCTDKGKKCIVETILEETFHIQSGRGDETRGFQDYLVNKFVGLLEEKSGVYL